MRIPPRWLLALLASTVFARGVALGQSATSSNDKDPWRARVLGAFDPATGQPIADVEVMDLVTGAARRTTSTGTVSLAFLPEGGSLVRVRKTGYLAQTFFVSISRADTLPITLVMDRLSQLPAVVTTATASPRVEYISPRLQAFEERRQEGLGYFISEAQLRKDEGTILSTMAVRFIPGLMVLRDIKGVPHLVSMRSAQTSMAGGAYCDVQLFLDGIPVSPDARDLDSNTGELAGVEFYAGGASLPVQYNTTGKGCGVLLLWSRER